MKILFFTKYGRAGASTRYRVFQYLKHLEQNSIGHTIHNLFADAYLHQLYATGKRDYRMILGGYARRFLQFFKAFRYDLIVIEYELFPYLPSFFEWLLKISGKKYVVDYDDAIFHHYDASPNRFIRFLLGKKIGRVMRYAQAVIAGSEYLYNYAILHNKTVIKIPTVVSMEKYDRISQPGANDKFTIGWVGSPSTSHYLLLLKDVFEKLSKEPVVFKFIGAGNSIPAVLENVPAVYVDWDEETEIQEIKTFSVGIMPLTDSPWSRGKCGFKLIQYMACSIPVIASPVGANREIVRHGENGFLAGTAEEWYSCILELLRNPVKRENMAKTGNQLFRESYSLEAMADIYYQVLIKASI